MSTTVYTATMALKDGGTPFVAGVFTSAEEAKRQLDKPEHRARYGHLAIEVHALNAPGKYTDVDVVYIWQTE